jgi:hypothetical protein
MTTTLQQLTASQANKEVAVNRNFETLSALGVYGKKQSTSTGLTWGYYGGRWSGFSVADGTHTLTNATSNYIVAKRSDGVTSVSTATTNWNNTTDYARVYKVTTAGSVVTATEDHRAGLYGVHGIAVSPTAVGDVVGPGSATNNNLVQFDGTTGKLIEDGGVAVSTDGTFAANSNAKIPTEAAVKTYVDAAVAGTSGNIPAQRYTIETANQTDSDPGAGLVKFDNATVASSTNIYIDDSTSDGVDLSTYFASLGATGFIKIQSVADAGEWAVFKWTGTTDGTGYWKFAVTPQASKGTLDDADAVVILFDSDVAGGGAVDSDDVTYAPTTVADWDGSADPGDVEQALDQLAERVTDLEGLGAGAGTKTYGKFTPMVSQPPASNFATLDTRNSIAVLDFDDSTEESIDVVDVLPEAANVASGLKVRLFLACTSATSGDIRFGAKFEKYGTDIDSDSFDTATEATIAASGTSGIEVVLEITCTTIDSIVAGDRYRLRVYRDTSGADTVTGDVELSAWEVRSAA